MEFATRDRYRHATERIAKEGRLTEAEVAAKAIELARASVAGKGSDDRAAHVGFYLIDKGLPELERAAAVEVSSVGALRRIGRRFPLLVYLGAIALIVRRRSPRASPRTPMRAGASREILALVVVLSLLATSQLAVTIVNWLATLLVTPHSLPRMDFSAGIAAEARTLVVVPTMLTSARDVEELVEALEVRFLANRDAHLHFGLLTDFPDAREESLPADAAAAATGRGADQRAESKIRARRGRIRPRAAWNATSDADASVPRPVCSICFTALDAGMRRNGSGWATNASAASLAT